MTQMFLILSLKSPFLIIFRAGFVTPCLNFKSGQKKKPGVKMVSIGVLGDLEFGVLGNYECETREGGDNGFGRRLLHFGRKLYILIKL